MKIDHPVDYVKLCLRCGETKPVSEWYKNAYKSDGLSGYCRMCEKSMPVHVSAENRKATHNKNYRLHRQALIDDLGGCCVCCDETQYEFLQIDHIYGNGGEYRKKLGRSNLDISGLRKHMDELQVLCGNCHQAKSRFGICPHQSNTDPH